ncbi:MAG: YicC/YloC family endoribonuclease [Polyangiaceae bacterium]|nr:YicC/YloC family endoribonuclease [Polyangiaceae bacterium]
MTGFGVGVSPYGSGRILAEIRALNHRFTDVRVRTPDTLSGETLFVEQLVRTHLSRGRLDVGIRFEGVEPASVELDPGRVRRLYQLLSALKEELAPESALTLDAVLRAPELVTVHTGQDIDQIRAVLTSAVEAAISNLNEMRTREGQTLAAELAARLENARKLLGEVRSRTAEGKSAYRERVQARLQHLLREVKAPIDEGRLEVELALLAERSDITEEMVRLESHFEQFGRVLKEPGAVGRKLEFLLQEMAREANTIGAKSQSASVNHLALEIKVELERMREQVQNVE